MKVIWDFKNGLEEERSVTANVLGPLMLHKSADKSDLRWTVSLVLCKLRVAAFLDRKTAQKFAETAYLKLAPFLVATDKQEVLKSLPAWVKYWVKGCLDAEECLDTEPFESLQWEEDT